MGRKINRSDIKTGSYWCYAEKQSKAKRQREFGGAILDKMVKKGLAELVTSEQKPV